MGNSYSDSSYQKKNILVPLEMFKWQHLLESSKRYKDKVLLSASGWW